MEWTPDRIADKLMIELRRCEVNVHLKTLKGGYCDVLVIGKEVYDLLIPQIKDKLQENYYRIILKPKMYKPFIRYIWFGDNEHFNKVENEDTGVLGHKRELEPDREIEDFERHLNLKREYLIEDIDNEIIKKILQE